MYWDPCAIKAGFHLTLALINQGAKEWQEKLTSIQQEMESAIAQRAGAPYKRAAGELPSLPDFIDIVVNAGDDRGAPERHDRPEPAEFRPGREGDPWPHGCDGEHLQRSGLARLAPSLRLDAFIANDSMADYSDDLLASQLVTVLHEATHNLGPAAASAARSRSARRPSSSPPCYAWPACSPVATSAIWPTRRRRWFHLVERYRYLAVPLRPGSTSARPGELFFHTDRRRRAGPRYGDATAAAFSPRGR